MEKLGLNEIRKLFRDFYVSKGHYPGKSASLIPQNDKSLLIINSGMAPLKNYFSGVETPPAKRMTTCQKCIRTGDIENVGITSRHGTFFEMLGSFSFGDYFKEQSLAWGLEFICDYLKMPMDKIWATVYENDDEAVEIWKKLGMPEDHIVRLGKEDNFWEIGLGPCGPCSEIYFDRGPAYGCGKPDCKPGCDCDRYLEFWNHVFTQFSKEEDGAYTDLAHPNIDTGMGLERLACIMQGVDSIFDIDTIRHILDGVVARCGVAYADGQAKTDVSIRIITDHLRSMTFMIADGIIPSNEGRGYVLRRLIRRAARHGRRLGIEGAFLSGLCERVIEVSGEAYPELIEKKAYIQKIIAGEEEKFAATIGQGETIIAQYIRELQDSGALSLNGEKIFKLYDTYGFPPELTEEILTEHNCKADLQGFMAKMKQQRELARANRKSTDEEAWKDADIAVEAGKTLFTGYRCDEDTVKIASIVGKDGTVSQAKAGETVRLYFDRTPFYAEGGGQIYDKGILSINGEAVAEVLAVEKTDGVFSHKVLLKQGVLKEGDVLTAEVDKSRRNCIKRNHTATHLLQKALQEVVGDHVRQAGSAVNETVLRFDFNHFEGVTAAQLAQVEALVNEKINAFLPVITKEMSMEEAQKMGAMALFGEKYGDVVRVVNVGDWSIELCGGTHVNNSGEIGAFKILSEGGVASGIRRIEAVTGTNVLMKANEYERTITEAAEILKTAKTNLVEKVRMTAEELRVLRKELEEMKKAAMGDEADRLLAEAKEIGGIKLITARFTDYEVADLRKLSDEIKAAQQHVIIVFATVNGPKVSFLVSISDDLVADGHHAGKMIKQIAAVCGGGGGGKADMAQAGGKDASKIDEAFALAETLI